jgi:hypothetical protein
VTSAAIALEEERPVVLEAVAPLERPKLEEFEVVAGGRLSTTLALTTIAVVQLCWLATLGYFLVAILH